MSGTTLYLVRHAAVAFRPELPAHAWRLSAEGRSAAEALGRREFWAEVRGIHSSPEPKAVATAQRIAAPHGLRMRIERDLREVEGRPWLDEGYEDAVRHYFAGEPVEGWEPRDEASSRIVACIDRIVSRHEVADVGVVSHGLVLTLYLSGLLGLDEAKTFELWSGIGLPDVAAVEPGERRLVRGFGSLE